MCSTLAVDIPRTVAAKVMHCVMALVCVYCLNLLSIYTAHEKYILPVDFGGCLRSTGVKVVYK